MKPKIRIMSNLIGAAVIVAFICLLFVPYFHYTADAALPENEAVQSTASISDYLWWPLNSKALIGELGGTFPEVMPSDSEYATPVIVLAVCGILSLVFVGIFFKKSIPSLCFAVTGAVGVAALIADLPLRAGGSIRGVLMILSLVLLLGGAFGLLLDMKKHPIKNQPKVLRMVCAALFLVLIITLLPVTMSTTSVSLRPAKIGETEGSNPYLAEGTLPFVNRVFIFTPVFAAALAFVCLIICLFVENKKWPGLVCLVSVGLLLYTLIANTVFDINSIPRFAAISAALLLAAACVCGIVLCGNASEKEAGPNKVNLTNVQKDHTIANVIAAVLLIAVLAITFTASVTETSLSFTVRNQGDTEATNPYAAEKPAAQFLGNFVLASPDLMFVIAVLTALISLYFYRNRAMLFVQLGAGFVCAYTLISNRVFANAPVCRWIAFGLSCLVAVTAIVRFVRLLLEGIKGEPATFNTLNLFVLIMTAVLLFLPFWTIEDPKSSKTPNRTIAQLFDMRPDQLSSDDNTVATALTKLNKNLSLDKKKTVEDILENNTKVKKIVDSVRESVSITTLLDNKLSTAIRTENRRAETPLPDTYRTDVLSLKYVPAVVLAAVAVYALLYLLRKDEAWLSFVSMAISVFGVVIFMTLPEFHFSAIYLLYLALYALLFVLSCFNIGTFVREKLEGLREYDSLIDKQAKPFKAASYRARAAQAMKGREGKGAVITLIDLAMKAILGAGIYVCCGFFVRSFEQGQPLLFLAFVAIIILFFILEGACRVGLTYAYLHMLRSDLSVSDYLAAFRRNKVGSFSGLSLKMILYPNIGLVVYFVVAALNLLTEKAMSPLILILSIALEIVGLLIIYNYICAPFILCDNVNFTSQECITGSTDLMKWKKWQMFCLNWSYAGWYLLGVLTCGILFLFILPRQQTAKTLFYEDISAERDRLIKEHH